MEAKEALEISGVSSAGGRGRGLPCRQVPKMGMEMFPVIAWDPLTPLFSSSLPPPTFQGISAEVSLLLNSLQWLPSALG